MVAKRTWQVPMEGLANTKRALHLIAIGNVLHDGGGGGLMDFVVRNA
jgi:hypothetical protein